MKNTVRIFLGTLMLSGVFMISAAPANAAGTEQDSVYVYYGRAGVCTYVASEHIIYHWSQVNPGSGSPAYFVSDSFKTSIKATSATGTCGLIGNTLSFEQNGHVKIDGHSDGQYWPPQNFAITEFTYSNTSPGDINREYFHAFDFLAIDKNGTTNGWQRMNGIGQVTKKP